ncbi:MAG: hypothetical protein M1818_000348 [Claussenomyces sp. TS43310]|nr:MAG: hypothetical protein M1818_000348 [Claussenomyces sp. TS43310]
MAGKTWQEIHAAKKVEQLERIPAEWRLSEASLPTAGIVDLRPIAESCGLLSPQELVITRDYDATALIAAIADGTYTAVEVVKAFCKRAAVAQQVCNCLTEIMFLDAISAAEGLDNYFKETGKTVGPLHGLPMTFKECFHIKGYDASDGYISRAFDPSTHDSYMVELVRAAGAVVIAKTNTPQTMLCIESENNVFGRTKNPVVSHLTCGGSSGGEGCVLAFRGSALGIGTDVAGSIRIPSAANGIYGYKPSFGVLPMLGFAPSNWPGQNTGIPAVLGPLAHSARDLVLLTRVIRDMQPWHGDPAVIPDVLEAGTQSRRPVVGIFYKSGLTPHPPVYRALREAVAKLQNAGYEVKDFVPPDFVEIRKITKQLLTLDGLSYPKRELEKAGEPVLPAVESFGFWSEPAKTPEEHWALNAQKGAMQKQMLDRWQQAEVDVVICPAGPYTAVLPGGWISDHYTVAWNAVDYPAVVIPFISADSELDQKDANFLATSSADGSVQALYDPKLMAGAPVCLQIVGSRLRDEQLLEDVKMIDGVLNG